MCCSPRAVWTKYFQIFFSVRVVPALLHFLTMSREPLSASSVMMLRTVPSWKEPRYLITCGFSFASTRTSCTASACSLRDMQRSITCLIATSLPSLFRLARHTTPWLPLPNCVCRSSLELIF
eukprot:16730_6